MEAGQGEAGDLRELFARAIEQPPHLRSEFLGSLPITPEIRAELQELLAADAGSETFLQRTVSTERIPEPDVGERFGPYETRQLLGQGGMGVVFLAERSDGEIEQTVAVKVVRQAWFDPGAIARFRNERQMLSGLVHANIARLLDGGTRADGVPYLVMEYVDGIGLSAYCERHGLDLAARLRLFLPLCDAVEYAHARLIIHRDLKPSNVLVTAQGEPKLLDFGIARALDSAPGGETRTVSLTPDFASPEQVRGEQATTATDVYGLGGVLYYLLTGKPTHAVTGVSPHELQRAICETAPRPPSEIDPALKGDLENILLKALHLEPQRRYGSVQEFREDLERYLSLRPVRATRDGWAYRGRRLLQRHRFASAAVAVALLAIAAGTATALYQAHRAQQRFAQVRELANRFVFEFEASIRDTPGTLEARRNMAATARQYLASLAAEAAGDRSLQRELAESYYRLSQVESAAQENELWLDDLRKSAAILRNLRDDCCGPPAQRALYVSVLDDIVRYWIDRSPGQGLSVSAESMRVARAFYQQSPGDSLAGKAVMEATLTQGIVQSNVYRVNEARQSVEEALRWADDLRRRYPGDEELVYQRALIGNRLTGILGLLDEVEAARAAEADAIAILDPLIAKRPENVRWRNLRIRMAASSANLLRRAARRNPALAPGVDPAFRDACTLARENAQRNPGNHEALDLAYVMTARYANQLGIEHKPAAALVLHREAAEILAVLAASEPSDHRTLSLRASNWTSRGVLLAELKRWAEAASLLGQGAAQVDQIMSKWPDDVMSLGVQVTALAYLCRTERHLGDLDHARRHCRQGFAVARVLAIQKGDEKQPVENLDVLRAEARALGVADTLPTEAPR